MTSVKNIIIGDSKVGKQTLLLSHIRNQYTEPDLIRTYDYRETINVDGKLVSLDTHIAPSSDVYARLRPLLYPNTNVFIVCFSLVDRSSFDNVKSIWQPELAQHSPAIPIILIGTKRDLRDDRECVENIQPVSSREGCLLCKEVNALTYIECSAVYLSNIHHVFEESVRAAYYLPTSKKPRCLVM